MQIITKICPRCSENYTVTTWRGIHEQIYCSQSCSSKRPSQHKKNKNSVKSTVRSTDRIPNYQSIHYWVRKQLGRPSYCVQCGKTEGYFDWSNISGKYLKDITDWQRLCRKCHVAYDDVQKKSRATLHKRYGTMGSRSAHLIIKGIHEAENSQPTKIINP